MEEVFWAQKARKDWTKKGDRNTRYFHAIVRKRRAANRITRLKNHLDQWIDEDQNLRDHIQQHFQSIFHSESRVNTATIMEVLNEYTLPRLSHLHRQILDREFNIEEIKKAAFQLGSWKAPGPDGIPAMLFQKCWDTMGQTVIQATLSFLRTGYILKELNNTFITLVPKSLNPEKISEYRPISLCNVAYKIAAKVLANRLKLVID